MSKRYLLSLAALLLVSLSCGALDYPGEPLPEGWLPIHESQLTALDEVLTTLETQSQELRMQLDRALTQLNAAQQSLTKSTRLLGEAEAYLTTLGTKVQTLIFQRNIAIGCAIGAALLAAASFIFF